MFDHCLAPNTLGDGTGCDNMTAIIVKFKFNSLKRAASSEELDEPDIKRTKTEENTEVQSTAAWIFCILESVTQILTYTNYQIWLWRYNRYFHVASTKPYIF